MSSKIVCHSANRHAALGAVIDQTVTSDSDIWPFKHSGNIVTATNLTEEYNSGFSYDKSTDTLICETFCEPGALTYYDNAVKLSTYRPSIGLDNQNRIELQGITTSMVFYDDDGFLVPREAILPAIYRYRYRSSNSFVGWAPNPRITIGGGNYIGHNAFSLPNHFAAIGDESFYESAHGDFAMLNGVNNYISYKLGITNNDYDGNFQPLTREHIGVILLYNIRFVNGKYIFKQSLPSTQCFRIVYDAQRTSLIFWNVN